MNFNNLLSISMTVKARYPSFLNLWTSDSDNNNVYILVRDYDIYPIDDVLMDSSCNISIDISYVNGFENPLIVGVDIRDKQNVLPQVFDISSKSFPNYTMIDFVKNINDDTLNKCYIEDSCAFKNVLLDKKEIKCALQIYKNHDNKLVRICMYEPKQTTVIEDLQNLTI